MKAENAIAVIDATSGKGLSDRIHYIYSASVRNFTDVVCGALMDGVLRGNADFALGFIAAINALMLDTVDFADPVGTIVQADADVKDTSDAMRKVTDCLVHYCEAIGGRR